MVPNGSRYHKEYDRNTRILGASRVGSPPIGRCAARLDEPSIQAQHTVRSASDALSLPVDGFRPVVA